MRHKTEGIYRRANGLSSQSEESRRVDQTLASGNVRACLMPKDIQHPEAGHWEIFQQLEVTGRQKYSIVKRVSKSRDKTHAEIII